MWSSTPYVHRKEQQSSVSRWLKARTFILILPSDSWCGWSNPHSEPLSAQLWKGLGRPEGITNSNHRRSRSTQVQSKSQRGVCVCACVCVSPLTLLCRLESGYNEHLRQYEKRGQERRGPLDVPVTLPCDCVMNVPSLCVCLPHWLSRAPQDGSGLGQQLIAKVFPNCGWSPWSHSHSHRAFMNCIDSAIVNYRPWQYSRYYSALLKKRLWNILG